MSTPSTVSGSATVGGKAYPVTAAVTLPAAVTPPPGTPVIITAPGGAADFAYSAQPGWSAWPNHGGAAVMNGVQNTNSPPFTSQVATAENLGSWSVLSDIAAGNKSVTSYPCTQNWLSTSAGGPYPLSSVTSLVSTWAVTVPPSAPGDDYEAAYDLWTQGEAAFAKAYGPAEIMIWVWNHGQTPAGTNKGNVTINGVSYQLWVEGGGTPISLVMNTPALSGTVNLLAVFQWLIAGSYLAADTGLFGLDFGFELCSTSGVAKTFGVTNLTMEAVLAS